MNIRASEVLPVLLALGNLMEVVRGCQKLVADEHIAADCEKTEEEYEGDLSEEERHQNWCERKEREARQLGLLEKCISELQDIIRNFEESLDEPAILQTIDHDRVVEILKMFFNMTAQNLARLPNLSLWRHHKPSTILRSPPATEFLEKLYVISMALSAYEVQPITILDIFGAESEE